MPIRLTLSDSKMFPVQAFFNSVSDSSFVKVIDWLTKGIGYSIDVAHVNFPTDLDPWEQPFEGVRFSIYEDSVTISREKLMEIIRPLCADYCSQHPKDEAAIKGFLDRK